VGAAPRRSSSLTHSPQEAGHSAVPVVFSLYQALRMSWFFPEKFCLQGAGHLSCFLRDQLYPVLENKNGQGGGFRDDQNLIRFLEYLDPSNIILLA